MSNKFWVRFALLLIFLVFLLAFISSCLFPEKFEIKINIKKDGTYTLIYDGILTYMLARAAEVQQGKLSAKEEREIKELEREFTKDPKFKKVSYIGHGQFKVLYERKGNLNSPVYFLDSQTRILSIMSIKGGKVEIKGMKLKGEDLSHLTALNMKVDGNVKVTSNAKVIEHNAKNVPKFFGLLGSYEWQIKALNDPAPYMLLQLQ